MNKKAELFQKYLEEKEITCFTVETVEEDKLNTVVYRSFIEVDGQELPTLVILDSSIYGMIRVKVANSVLRENNEKELLQHINEINRQYKIFKYYVAKDGSLFLDCCILDNNGELNCDMVYTILDVIIKHLNTEYKNLMKLIWG